MAVKATMAPHANHHPGCLLTLFSKKQTADLLERCYAFF